MVTGNLSPLLLAGVFYLVVTVPLTHVVNAIDNRLRIGKRHRRLSAEQALQHCPTLAADRLSSGVIHYDATADGQG